MAAVDLRFIKLGTMADLAAENRILKLGRPAFEVDTSRMKIGNGVTLWNDLPYQETVTPDTENIDGGQSSSLFTDSPIDGGES